MKLSRRIALILTLALIPIMVLWAALFFFAVEREVVEETDDALEEYAELIITRYNDGRVLPALNSGGKSIYTLTPISDEEARHMPREEYYDKEVYIPEHDDTEPARVLSTVFRDKEGRYLHLEVAMPTIEKDDLVATVLTWSVVLFGVLLIAVVVVSMLVFRGALRPLYALLKWLDGYKPGEGHQPVPNETNIKEFRRLNEAADSAVKRSEAMVESQKQFIANASHELQTPLAVIGNRVEHIIDHTSPNEEQLEELVKIQQSLRHSVRLNRTLLQLMRIDSGEVAESEDVDIVTLIRECAENCSEVYEAKAIECAMHLPERFELRMNETLARTTVINLVKNAYVYSPAGGTVTITLNARRLTVANAGDEPLDSARVFDRFYTRTTREGSTGLGLAIVKAVADHYGFRVSYAFTHHRHTFTVEF